MRTKCKAKINWMLAAAVSSALAAGAQAATVTWIGGGADDKWSTLGNWDLGVPVSRDVLVFDGSTRLTPDNDLVAGTRFDNLTFSAGAGAFTLGGNGISLGGGNTGLTNIFSGVNN